MGHACDIIGKKDSNGNDYNANAAYFDQISLKQEPVQTYTYDQDGKPVDAKNGSNARTAYEYFSGTELLKNYTDAVGVTTACSPDRQVRWTVRDIPMTAWEG